jgi:hypothetical protein
MKLSKLKQAVDRAIECALECERDPDEIQVSLQIGHPEGEIWGMDNLEVHWDDDCMASGCVLTAWQTTVPEKKGHTNPMDAWKRQLAAMERERATAHDYPEDYTNENGMYHSSCCVCKAVFLGHKRRVTCRKCAKEGTPEEVEAEAEERKEYKLIFPEDGEPIFFKGSMRINPTWNQWNGHQINGVAHTQSHFIFKGGHVGYHWNSIQHGQAESIVFAKV